VPNPLTLTGSSVGYTPLVLTSTEAAAAAGPILNLYRDSASPAANDVLGQVLFNGEDSAGNTQEYGAIEALIVSPTSTSEVGALDIYTTIGGTRTRTMSVGPNNPNTTTQFIDGYVTTATAAGTTTLTVASAGQQFFTGSTTQTVVLPVTSTLVLGQQFEIVNNSTGAVTVNSSGSNLVYTLAPNEAVTVTCILTSGTTAASWSTFPHPSGLGYACRAWVNFNGTGTVAINGSGNVSSITDNGTGDYTVNFTVAMPDTNYNAVVMARATASVNAIASPQLFGTKTTSAFQITTVQNAIDASIDSSEVGLSFFR
jgi:hypothetical protein